MKHYNVYFIQDITGPVKIGMAKDVEKRLSDLQIGNPRQLIIRGIVGNLSKKAAESLENKFHHKFKQHRIRGEWFTGKVLSKKWFSNKVKVPNEAAIMVFSFSL